MEGIMIRKYSLILLTAIFCLVFIVVPPEKAYTEEKLTPEELVARHLKSIGSPEALAAVKTRQVTGITTLENTELSPGCFLFASTEDKIAMVVNFDNVSILIMYQ
jgi:hypothetical protein